MTIVTESAAEILTRARLAAGLTQQQVAARAGVTQSVVSAYEKGRREPSLPVLRRLVDAAGARLVIDYAPVTMLERVRAHRDELIAELARLGATNVRVFGSVARGEETADSDVDLLVHLSDGLSLFDLGEMQAEAGSILGVPVDLVPDVGLKDGVRENVLREAVPL